MTYEVDDRLIGFGTWASTQKTAETFSLERGGETHEVS
jgi:hypothetical protein